MHDLPPIGYSAPPATASHTVPIFLSLILLSAGATAVLTVEIARGLARITPPATQPAPRLNPKDQTRCCDANGNRIVRR